MKKNGPDTDSMIYWLFNRDSYNDLEPNSPLFFEGQLPKKTRPFPFKPRGPIWVLGMCYQIPIAEWYTPLKNPKSSGENFIAQGGIMEASGI